MLVSEQFWQVGASGFGLLLLLLLPHCVCIPYVEVLPHTAAVLIADGCTALGCPACSNIGWQVVLALAYRLPFTYHLPTHVAGGHRLWQPSAEMFLQLTSLSTHCACDSSPSLALPLQACLTSCPIACCPAPTAALAVLQLQNGDWCRWAAAARPAALEAIRAAVAPISLLWGSAASSAAAAAAAPSGEVAAGAAGTGQGGADTFLQQQQRLACHAVLAFGQVYVGLGLGSYLVWLLERHSRHTFLLQVTNGLVGGRGWLCGCGWLGMAGHKLLPLVCVRSVQSNVSLFPLCFSSCVKF